ncbi:MAG: hypothetical protein A2Y97_06735 [Nitrospirae bacterium RBG_13_39_12]|nr:MAG: hypothetical protein A2Y97_06735 [Nitrospirae bacterium RBG_13_39_12]
MSCFINNFTAIVISSEARNFVLRLLPPKQVRGRNDTVKKDHKNYAKTMRMKKNKGFTILELIAVIFLMTLILGLSTIYFANILPSTKFNTTTRDISTTIRYAKSLSQIQGENKTVTIDLDSKKYGIEGIGSKDIPDDIYIKVIDPMLGEIQDGKYHIVLNAIGGIEGGTIVLWNNKKTVNIQMDPVVGSVVINEPAI